MHQVVIRSQSVEIFFSADDPAFLDRQLSRWCALFIPGLPVSTEAANAFIPKNNLTEATTPQSAPRAEVIETSLENIPGAVVLPLPESIPVTKAGNTSQPVSDNKGFDQVLTQVMADLGEIEQTDNHTENISDLTTSPAALIESLADLCEMANVETAEHTLLLAAYYLKFFEGEERFTLKQVNSQLLLANESSVSHTILASAIDSGYLTMVPDLTGNADVTEYQLTETSRTTVENWLKVAAAT